jgi:hypothetical protein
VRLGVVGLGSSQASAVSAVQACVQSLLTDIFFLFSQVLLEIQKQLLDYRGLGISVLGEAHSWILLLKSRSFKPRLCSAWSSIQSNRL